MIFLFIFQVDANEAKIAIETAKIDIKRADEAVDFFNKMLDQTVPWQTFSDSLFEMDKYRTDFSVATAALILQIKRLLLNAMDAYFVATRNIYGWCNIASHLITAYVNLFDSISREKSAAQKAILLEILNMGIDKMTKVQNGLDVITTNFTEASETLTSLQVRLDNEFDVRRDWYRMKKRQIKEKIKNNVTFIGPFGVIFGTNVTESMAKLHGKMLSSKRFYSQLKVIVNKALVNIDEAKLKLNDEIHIFRHLKMQTAETKPFESFGDAGLRDTVIRFAESLSTKCNEYRKRHN